MKTLKPTIAAVLGLETHSPNLEFSKGKYILRREYYWRPKIAPEVSFANAIAKLQDAGFQLSDVEYGDVFQAFRGGESVKKNSHIWLSFKAIKKETPNA